MHRDYSFWQNSMSNGIDEFDILRRVIYKASLHAIEDYGWYLESLTYMLS